MKYLLVSLIAALVLLSSTQATATGYIEGIITQDQHVMENVMAYAVPVKKMSKKRSLEWLSKCIKKANGHSVTSDKGKYKIPVSPDNDYYILVRIGKMIHVSKRPSFLVRTNHTQHINMDLE